MAPRAEFQLSDDVLVPRFGGFGVQLNHHVFAPMTVELGAPETSFPDLRRKVIDLAPQVVRIFYNNLHEGVPFVESRPASAVIVRQDRQGSTSPPSYVTTYRIGGLPNNTSFQRLHWNLGGAGKMRLEKQAVKVKDGVVTIAAPIHSVFALTTKKPPPL